MISSAETKTIPVPSSTVMPEPPTVHMIFVGEIVADKPGAKIPGFDTIGPRLMSASCDQLIIFWCLKSQEEAYKKVFKDLIDTKKFKVSNIEDHFCQRFENTEMAKIAERMYQMFNVLLSPGHATCSGNKGVAKAFFSFFLMATSGGWEIDTNVLPHVGEKVTFSRLGGFCLPEIVRGDTRQSDIYLKFGSDLNKEKAIYYCQKMILEWDKLQAQCLAVDSYDYYLLLFQIFWNTLDADYEDGIIKPLTFGEHPLDTSFSCAVDEPKILKVFWGTHHHKEHKSKGKDLPVLSRAIAVGHPDLVIQLMAHGAKLDSKDGFLHELINNFRSGPQISNLRSALCLLLVLHRQAGLLEESQRKDCNFSGSKRMTLVLKTALSDTLKKSIRKLTRASEFDLIAINEKFIKSGDINSIRDFLKANNRNKVDEIFKEILRDELKIILEKFFCKKEFAFLAESGESGLRMDEILSWINLSPAKPEESKSEELSLSKPFIPIGGFGIFGYSSVADIQNAELSSSVAENTPRNG